MEQKLPCPVLLVAERERPHRLSSRKNTGAAFDAPPRIIPYPVYGYVTTGLTTSGLVWLTVAPVPLMTCVIWPVPLRKTVPIS